MTPGKKQANALGGTVGVEGQASEERIAEITSGRTGSQQGLAATCKDRRTKCGYTNSEEGTGFAHELVRAMKKG
jgi:hypothetical protein